MTNRKQPRAQTSRRMQETLRSIRLKAGMTQKDLGAQLGITNGAISAIEAGHRDTTVPVFERWVSSTGHKYAVFPEDEDVLSLSHLSVERRETVLRLVHVIHRLDPLLVATLQQQLQLWSPVIPSEEEVTHSSPIVAS